MSSDYHTPVAFKAAANSSVVNTPMGQLDQAIGDIKNGKVFDAATILTIAGGIVTQAEGRHIIAAQSATADDLDTIEPLSSAQLLLLTADAGDTITLKDGTGNLTLGADVAMDDATAVLLYYDGAAWLLVGSAGGATLPVEETTALVYQTGDPTAEAGIDVSAVDTATRVDIIMPNADVVLHKNNLSASAAPTANDDSGDGYAVGSVWIDTTNDDVYQCVDASVGAAVWEQLNGSSGGGNTTLFSATADKTVANTTTETSLFGTGVGSLTLSANALAAGYAIRITLFGYKSNPGSAGTITVRLKLGGNTLASVVVTPGTTTNTLVELRALITCRSAGVSGTVLGQGHMQAPETVTTNRYWDLVTTGGATTVDTTGTLAVDVTWEWQTANANRTVTITNAVVELLPVS